MKKTVLIFFALVVVATSSTHGEAPPPRPVDCTKGVVFVVDGSGRLRLMTRDLGCVVAEAGLPLEVTEFNWSHGNYRWLADLRGAWNQKCTGKKLAEMILARRAAQPGCKVFVVTHSAGAAVALAAAEYLPPTCVDRFVLLAPAVSPKCSVRAALCASACGVDVYYSPRDLISVGLALTGCADGAHRWSAGLFGFKQDLDDCCPNLRQHCYVFAMAKTGHYGGHYGWTKIGFLRQYIVPLLACCDCGQPHD